MPTYEYQCNACGREFEYQQRMADPDLTTCEVCGEDKLEKLISRTAFQLKGSGWYKDLYSSKPAEAIKDSVDKGKPEKAAAKPDPGSGTGSGGGSDGGSSSGSSDSGSGGSGSSGGSDGGSGGTSASPAAASGS
jgi:putative FmdB family regulatory protein